MTVNLPILSRVAFALGILAIGFAAGRGDGLAFTAAIAAFVAGVLAGAIGMASVLVVWVRKIERFERMGAHVEAEV